MIPFFLKQMQDALEWQKAKSEVTEVVNFLELADGGSVVPVDVLDQDADWYEGSIIEFEPYLFRVINEVDLATGAVELLNPLTTAEQTAALELGTATIHTGPLADFVVHRYDGMENPEAEITLYADGLATEGFGTGPVWRMRVTGWANVLRRMKTIRPRAEQPTAAEIAETWTTSGDEFWMAVEQIRALLQTSLVDHEVNITALDLTAFSQIAERGTTKQHATYWLGRMRWEIPDQLVSGAS